MTAFGRLNWERTNATVYSVNHDGAEPICMTSHPRCNLGTVALSPSNPELLPLAKTIFPQALQLTSRFFLRPQSY